MLVRRLRELRLPIAVVIVMALVEAVALRVSGLGIALVATIAVAAVALAFSDADLPRLGVWAAYACAFTLSWNGWYVGPVRPGDVLVLVALLLFAVSAPTETLRSPPWWVRQLVVVLVVLVVLLVVRPPDATFLVSRVRLDAGGGVLPAPPSSALSNLGNGAKFVVGIAAIPVAFGAAALADSRAAGRLGIAFATGTALSGFVAFVDRTHVASLGHFLTGVPAGATRQLGFSSQPNFLAAALVLAVPFAAWLTASHDPREQRTGAVSLLFLVLGVYASGSRGGAVMVVVTVVVAYGLLARSRRYVPALVATGVAVAALVVLAFPAFEHMVLDATRLGAGSGASGSSAIRAVVRHQGAVDFAHYPYYGIGLQFGTDASQVYLQELSAGGLLLFAGVNVYLAGAAVDAGRLMSRDPLAAAVLAAIVATVGLDFVEADLTDRFYYVPEAILVAMLIARAAASRKKPDYLAPPEVATPRRA